MSLLLVLALFCAPLVVLAVIACAYAPSGTSSGGDHTPGGYGLASCTGVTAGYKAVGVNQYTGQRIVYAADGRQVVDLV